MKLLLCARCMSTVTLVTRERRCVCGRTWGRRRWKYRHPIIYGGPCVVLGIEDKDLARAIRTAASTERTQRFVAVVIGHRASTLIRTRRPTCKTETKRKRRGEHS